MGKILIIYDTDSDRRFTEIKVPLVKVGIESVDSLEVRVRHGHAADRPLDGFGRG